MMDSEDGTIEWLRRLAAGESDTVERFWERYAMPLERLASGRLSPVLQRQVGQMIFFNPSAELFSASTLGRL